MRKSSPFRTPRGMREPCDICGKPNAPTWYGEALVSVHARLNKYTKPEWIVLSGYAHQLCYNNALQSADRMEGRPTTPLKRGHCTVCGRWGGGWEPDLIKSLIRYCRELNVPGMWTLKSDYIHVRCAKQVDEAIRDARERVNYRQGRIT